MNFYLCRAFTSSGTHRFNTKSSGTILSETCYGNAGMKDRSCYIRHHNLHTGKIVVGLSNHWMWYFCFQMVSFSAAFRSLIKFEDVTKPFCVRSLLEVVENFASKIRFVLFIFLSITFREGNRDLIPSCLIEKYQDQTLFHLSFVDLRKVYVSRRNEFALWTTYILNSLFLSCRGIAEDSLQLATSLRFLLKWLYGLVHKCMQKLHEDKSSEHGVLAEKCCEVIDVLISTKPSRALLYIARLEDEGRKCKCCELALQYCMSLINQMIWGIIDLADKHVHHSAQNMTDSTNFWYTHSSDPRSGEEWDMLVMNRTCTYIIW